VTFFVQANRQFVVSVALVTATLLSINSTQASGKTQTTKKVKRVIDPDLKMNHVFKGADVTGRFSASPEGIVTVEADKSLRNLLKKRPDFKDRVQFLLEQR
jgi:hypothetical protein